VEELARALCDGKQARAFDHQVRRCESGRPPLGFGRPEDGSAPSALGRVHNHYSPASARRRLCGVFPEAASDAPFLLLNVWRAMVHVVQDTPLAVCDARSVNVADWVVADLIYRERTGEINLVTYRPEHRWYYYPDRRPEEVLVFISSGSRPHGNVAKADTMTPHCAFDLPHIPANAPLRQSMEVRCAVLL